jgi:glycosyltransferase involved in cell wall biosynthesis
MTRITGTIITFNEEDHIEACIASLQRVCDEIVVVDSLSTDRTCALAERAGALVIHQQYLGEGRQRNVTERESPTDWILALDADERLDDEMAAAIPSLDFGNADIGYAFNRKSFVGQRWVSGPGWYPDYITRLYNRTRSSYAAKYGHAGVIAPQVVRAPGHILHYTYDDYSDWVAKINQVTSLDARGMYEAGRAASAWKPALSALSALFRQLILRGGLFCGPHGRTIAMTSAFRSYMKYLKLNEFHEQAEVKRGGGTTRADGEQG